MPIRRSNPTRSFANQVPSNARSRVLHRSGLDPIYLRGYQIRLPIPYSSCRLDCARMHSQVWHANNRVGLLDSSTFIARESQSRRASSAARLGANLVPVSGLSEALHDPEASRPCTIKNALTV